MEFSPDILAFQGAVTSIGSTICLSRISTRGGNEELIKNVIEELLSVLIELKYVSIENPVIEKRNKLCKIALYLVLNSDLSVLQQMTDIDGIGSMIHTTPVISKCLMCEMLWSLHMEQFIYEMITYIWPPLAIEVAQSFVNSIKYFLPNECIHKMELLTLSCYKQICGIHNFVLTNHEKHSILKSALVNFQLCLNYFTNPPNADKLDRLCADEQYKYIGDNFYAMLKLVSKCFEHYTVMQDCCLSENIDIYKCTYRNGSHITSHQSINFSECKNLNPQLKDSINKCNMLILDKCKDLVMNISVEIFCAWSEFEENGQSMQQRIGETCYKVHTQLSNLNDVSKHSLINMLQPLSRKPETVDDIIHSNNFDVILEKIENSGEDKATWLRSLLTKNNLCDETNVLFYLERHLNILNEDDFLVFYKILKEYINQPSVSDLNHFKAVTEISHKVFQCCSINDRLAIVREHFESKRFHNLLMIAEFENMVIQIFNKLLDSENSDVSDVLNVFIQNPSYVYSKIFYIATENAHQTDIMLKVMKILCEFSEHYYESDVEPCLIKIAKEALETKFDLEAKKVNLVNFVRGLKTNNIITGTKLLLLVIMPILHKVLLNKDIAAMNIQIRLLNAAYTIEELVEYRAPMLVMLSHVLHLVRWNIESYTPLAPATLQVTLDLQKTLFNSYGTTIPDRDSKWLKARLQDIRPLNQYYFRQLWNPPGSNFVEIVSGSRVDINMNTHNLVTWLSRVLVQCIQEEWFLVWDSLFILGDANALNAVHDSVCVLTTLESMNQSRSTWACLLQCYQNYISIIRFKFIKDPLNNSQVVMVAGKISAIANLMNEDRANTIISLLTPLLAYLAEKRADYTFDIRQYLENNLHFANCVSVVNQIFVTN